MRASRGILRTLAVIALAGVLAGCEGELQNRGHVPLPGAIEKLEAGSQGRDDVLRLLGSPSTIAPFGETWYYVTQRSEQIAFLNPTPIEQRVVAINFGANGRISDIKQYDIKDARDIDMVARKTPTSGREITVLEQLLGNVGKFATPKRETPGASTGRTY